MNTIANDLKVIRIRKGLLQKDVAKKLGFTSTERISKWEKGRAVPSLINLLKLSVIYNEYPNEFYKELFSRLLSNENLRNSLVPDMKEQ